MPGIDEITFKAAANRKFDLIEQKVDGSRHTYQNGRLVSDRGINRAIDRFPHIANELRVLNVHCRGEVAVPNGNVLQLNNSLNWHRAKYYIFDLYSVNGLDFTKVGAVAQREALETIISKMNFANILLPDRFGSFDEGWQHITKNALEGLVLKNDNGAMWKIKHMKEEKLRIIGHERGSTKGAFVLDRNGVRCRVSGTSEAFVQRAYDIVKAGGVPYAEIEYLFVTEDGHPYQPRLRRIGTLDMLKS